MPIDISPGSLAAATITTLFWWTVLSPAGLLAVAVFCGRRPRLRAALTIAVLVPPVVTLLPVAVIHGGLEAVAAAAAVVVLAAAIVLAVASLVRRRDAPERAEQYATAALLAGVAGGMVGSAALVGALLFG
jgi:VIT1/CCC1 family predicted Fe2+/Mn2+ transporter